MRVYHRLMRLSLPAAVRERGPALTAEPAGAAASSFPHPVCRAAASPRITASSLPTLSSLNPGWTPGYEASLKMSWKKKRT